MPPFVEAASYSEAEGSVKLEVGYSFRPQSKRAGDVGGPSEGAAGGHARGRRGAAEEDAKRTKGELSALDEASGVPNRGESERREGMPGQARVRRVRGKDAKVPRPKGEQSGVGGGDMQICEQDVLLETGWIVSR